MCGIVGYFGEKEASPFILEGLSKLEYRGYDSAGIAILKDGEITVSKCKGRLKNLSDKLENAPLAGKIGIGHTRWATHGEPSDTNSHPHCNNDDTISVVHNGIIENYMELKKWLQEKGYKFLSETDTEVIPNLVDYYYEGDLLDAVIKATHKMEGSYAIGVISVNEPGKLIAVRKDSPLIVGLGNKEYFIASDIPAVLNHTREVYLLEDKEFVIIEDKGITLVNEDKEVINKEIYHVTWSVDAAEKGGFEDFTMKEIHEQPKALRDTLSGRVVVGEKIKLDNIKLSKEDLEGFGKIYIVACGTAYHAGLVGKYLLEDFAKTPVEVDVASEFRYRNPLIDDKTLLIVVSQSGETADTLACLREAKKKGARTLAITNVVGSSVSREAHDVFYTWAGPEIAVASTKAYLTQLVALNILTLYFAELKGTKTFEEIDEIKKELLLLPEKVERVIKNKEVVQKFASRHYMERSMFYLGRGLDYALALEGSLKMKELTYIHSEAYPGGELKHGPIALIEKGTVVITSFTQVALREKMLSNIKEVVTRGASILAVAYEDDHSLEESIEAIIPIPKTLDSLAPIIAVVPLQLLAYYIAVQKGLDVDKPRNLAKSVTVE